MSHWKSFQGIFLSPHCALLQWYLPPAACLSHRGPAWEAAEISLLPVKWHLNAMAWYLRPSSIRQLLPCPDLSFISMVVSLLQQWGSFTGLSEWCSNHYKEGIGTCTLKYCKMFSLDFLWWRAIPLLLSCSLSQVNFMFTLIKTPEWQDIYLLKWMFISFDMNWQSW